MARTALLVGATGLIGGNVLDVLIADARWSRVVVLARRAVEQKHEKVSEHIVDFEELADLETAPSAGGSRAGGALDGAPAGGAFAAVDDVFACLGTTIKVAGSQERFRRVDHDYTVAVARLARAAGGRGIALVSSIGASETTSSFYLRVKGETERDVRALDYPTTVIARPSILLGKRSENRPAERAGIAVANVLAPLMLGGLRAYRPIAARDVAIAMVEALGEQDVGEREEKKARNNVVRVLSYTELTS
jgi:uncharacterized protein YbjT (DUF2867 family)